MNVMQPPTDKFRTDSTVDCSNEVAIQPTGMKDKAAVGPPVYWANSQSSDLSVFGKYLLIFLSDQFLVNYVLLCTQIHYAL